jgi:hypothetical protein
MIWYNPLKTTELMVAAAERQMIETGEKISERIGLLYGPLYAIVAIASQVPELKAPLHGDGHTGRAMLLRALRFYPQILSLYVGFDNGDFFMVSHIAGEAVRPSVLCSRRQRRPLSRTRSLLPGVTACGPSAGYFSTMTVSRSAAVTSLRRVSTLVGAPGMDRRATVIANGVICTSSPRTTSRVTEPLLHRAMPASSGPTAASDLSDR